MFIYRQYQVTLFWGAYSIIIHDLDLFPPSRHLNSQGSHHVLSGSHFYG